MSFKPNNLNEISNFIDAYCLNNATKRDKISIIAVSKNKPIEVIEDSIRFGHRIFGESRVQEAFNKFSSLKKNYPDLQLHMIGPIQTNKIKKAIEIFDYIHTLDREKLANEFSKNLEGHNYNKKFFIQINIGKEKQKTGIEPSLACDFIKYCQHDLKLNIIGLMCIPPIKDDPETHFVNLKKIAYKNNLYSLSMGMSSDYKIAVQCQATHIRVGSFIFGDRNNK